MSKYKRFNYDRLNFKKMGSTESKSDISIMVDPRSAPPEISSLERDTLEQIADNIMESREKDRPVVVEYGGHLFNNGCSPLLIEMMRLGDVNQLLNKGAGSIHDFEMTTKGETEEDVRANMPVGKFGMRWETGVLMHTAFAIGAKQDMGMGESLGYLLDSAPFQYKQHSLLYNAYNMDVPLSVSVGWGQDIIHNHPMRDRAAMGITSGIDMEIFTETMTHMEEGVLLSIGSAVMSPMVNEKSIAAGFNVALGEDRAYGNHKTYVVDIQGQGWDWNQGEPPKDHPDYYLRFCKTFDRIGHMEYVRMDNKKFLHNLYRILADNP